MKKIILLMAFILFFASSAWSLVITTSSGSYEAGDVDTIYSSTYFDGQWGGYSGFAAEVAWVQSILGANIIMEEEDKTDVIKIIGATAKHRQVLQYGDLILRKVLITFLSRQGTLK